MVAPEGMGDSATARDPLFVGRDDQLDRLDDVLGEMLAGRGQVCFVVGEAGSGKTALVREFTTRAQERQPDLIVALGQSDAQTGIGDPYLPFRDVLAQLTGDVDTPLADGRISKENAGRLRRFLGVSGEAIVDFGPDLIGTFIPGAGLATRAAAYIAKKSGRLSKLEEMARRDDRHEAIDRGGIDQSHIFEQYTNVLSQLAVEQPLLVVLDDLHWADTASTALLFRLARRIGESRIMLLGTYRPAEVALGRGDLRHPLDKVVTELQRYFGDVTIDLSAVDALEGRQFVDALVDADSNQLGDEFRQALFSHTNGHPLFTVELLRSLQERGVLRRDDRGRWAESASLQWGELPARVEGVIEERIGRLESDLREILTVASVEGEEFTAEVIAYILSQEASRMARLLGRELEHRHRLVRSRGVVRIGPAGARLSQYGFRHNLIQRYVYEELGDAERSYLHEDVGNALEAICGNETDGLVMQLARHFAAAGVSAKAAAYLRRAGEQSLANFAHEEAAGYFTRSLEFTPEHAHRSRFELLGLREKAYEAVGAREAQAADLDRLESLADTLGDAGLRAQVTLRRAAHAKAIGDYGRAMEEANAAIRIASSNRDIAAEANGHLLWGSALIEQGRHDEAAPHLELTLGLAEGAALHRIQASSLSGLARICVQLGEHARGEPMYQEALRIYQRLGDSLGEAQIMTGLGNLVAGTADLHRARTYFERGLDLARKIGDQRQQAVSLANLAFVASEQLDPYTAHSLYAESLRISEMIGDDGLVCTTLANLAGEAIKLGLFDEAELRLTRGIEIAERIGRRGTIGHAHAWLALLFDARGESHEAESHSRRALAIGRELAHLPLTAHSLELLGKSLEGKGQTDGAVAEFEQAVAACRDAQHTAVEPMSGLARIALARGDLAAAAALVEQILAEIEVADQLIGSDFPIAPYATCYRVLAATGDARARQVLDAAQAALVAAAVKIPDPAVRRAFMEDIPVHREILEWRDEQTG